MDQLEYSSVPRWARPASTDVASIDADGRSFLLIGVGPDADLIVADWAATLPEDSTVTRCVSGDVGSAVARLSQLLTTATVGLRLLVAAPVGAALTLRATAAQAGLADDEIVIAACGDGPIDVFCAHCRAETTTTKTTGGTVTCVGCARNLIVYHHVSRRIGRYLGYMVDAERPAA